VIGINDFFQLTLIGADGSGQLTLIGRELTIIGTELKFIGASPQSLELTDYLNDRLKSN